VTAAHRHQWMDGGPLRDAARSGCAITVVAGVCMPWPPIAFSVPRHTARRCRARSRASPSSRPRRFLAATLPYERGHVARNNDPVVEPSCSRLQPRCMQRKRCTANDPMPRDQRRGPQCVWEPLGETAASAHTAGTASLGPDCSTRQGLALVTTPSALTHAQRPCFRNSVPPAFGCSAYPPGPRSAKMRRRRG
jgi:hypothetical protein